ncbi:hypothetical protein MMC16_005040 [Acarospora aff. strigata]|nr:hypothetical protein [Acarospora aff. strigata]
MASYSMPSTPTSQTVHAPSVPPSPGSWRHPALDEIQRRQYAGTFGEKNVKILVWNVVCLVLTWLLENLTGLSSVYKMLAMSSRYPFYLVLFFRLILLYNIGKALYPLARPKDEMLDIPLTPSQRALLGLDPNATPPLTSGQQYVTPPRYQRSRGGTPGSRHSSLPGSPLAGRDSGRGYMATPERSITPTTPKASVQLNSRWLYKKAMESDRALYMF